MPRLTPVHWKVLVCIFERDGFVYERTKGSHMSFSKPGILRPIVIPKYKEIDEDIIRGLMRSAGMTREDYFRLLEDCR